MPRTRPDPLTVFLLLASAVVALLWVYSYWSYDAVGLWPRPSQRNAYGFVSNRGSLCFIAVSEANGGRRWNWKHTTATGAGWLRGYAGFVLSRDKRGFAVGVPHPLVCLLLAVPAVRRRLRLARQRAEGFCRSCGYDLRATPNRCPECGTPAAANPSA